MRNAEYRLAALPFIAATRLHLALLIRHLPLAICHPSSALCHPPYGIRHRRFSRRRNLSCSHPILSEDWPVFHGFFRPPPSLARVPISKFPALSASSAASFLRLHSDVVLGETPDFRPFPARQASPTLGPNFSSDVPEGLITCRLRTQPPSLAPQNSGVQSHLSVSASSFWQASSVLGFVTTIYANYITKLS